MTVVSARVAEMGHVIQWTVFVKDAQHQEEAVVTTVSLTVGAAAEILAHLDRTVRAGTLKVI